MKFEFMIGGMKDLECVKRVRRALKRAGFEDVVVSLEPPSASLQSKNPLAVPAIERALREAGDYAAQFGIVRKRSDESGEGNS